MNSKKEETKMLWWQPSLVLFGRLSGWIGGPIIIALFVGKWLDKKYSSEPRLFLLCVGVAFIVSTFGIVKDALEAMKKITDDAQKAKALKDSTIQSPLPPGEDVRRTGEGATEYEDKSE